MLMTQAEQQRALHILHNMAMERERPWWAFWRRRFPIDHEPLRHDASNFIQDIGYCEKMRSDWRHVSERQESRR